MSRLSIELTQDEHKQLKATAALKGQTIKQYVLNRVLPSADEEAFSHLEAYLKPRIDAAERGELSTRTVKQIKRAARHGQEN